MAELHEIRQLLDDTACGLAQVPDVDRWGEWVVYLLEALETEAYKRDIDQDHPEQFEMMLSDLAANIAGRLETGRW